MRSTLVDKLFHNKLMHDCWKNYNDLYGRLMLFRYQLPKRFDGHHRQGEALICFYEEEL